MAKLYKEGNKEEKMLQITINISGMYYPFEPLFFYRALG